MRTHLTLWVIWLLMWAAAGQAAEQQVCSTGTAINSLHLGPGVTIQITAGETAVSLTNTNVGQAAECSKGQGSCGAQSVTIPAGTTATIRTVGSQQNVAATVALHEFVYKSDFEGLRQKMKQLGLKENQATLISALQSVDDKGMTIAHLLSCAGRAEELGLVIQAMQAVGGLGQFAADVFRRATLEALSWNASCTSCRPDRTQFEVVPHLRLELTSPKQTIFLYGNVTPLECAAAHGHVDAMKLLMQNGVAPGRALIVAQHLGLETKLIEAVTRAKSESGTGVQLHPDLPVKVDTPLRKPRQRRTEAKTKSKNKSSSGAAASTTSKQKAATATAQHQHQGTAAATVGCTQTPPAISMTPQSLSVPRPGGPPSVIGTVSTSILGIRGGKDQDASTPLTSKGKSSKMSEAMDVTALWLLSIMLLFPAWSTACLLWRKMMKRRWAVQDSVSRVRRGISAVVKPFKRESTGAAAAATSAAAGAAATAAAAPQRSSGSDSSNDSKGSKAGAAAPRQQRKPGPSIALPGSSSGPQGSGQADSPTALFKSISAPEAALRTHLSSSARDAAQAAGNGADARRQGSTEAGPQAGKAAKAAAALGGHAVHRQGSSTGAVTKAPDKGPAGSSSKAATGTAAASAGDSKQGRNKHAAAAAAAATGHAQAQDSSKGKHGGAQRKSVTISTKAAAASAGQASSSSPSSSTAAAATSSQATTTRQPQVLVRAKKSDKGAAAASSAQACTTTTPTKSGSGDSSRAADTTHAGPSSSTKPKSALSAALKPSRAGPRHAAAELEVGSPSSSGGGGGSSSRALGCRFSGVSSPLGSPPGSSRSPASGPSPRGSNRFTVAAAAAAAEAARDAAAASTSAAASLRRTASGGAVLSPTRSPAKDFDDVLARTRDQDKPAGSEEDAASSAGPSGNAWTPAAAAARAARAAVTPVKSQKDGEEDAECAEAAAAAGPAEAQADGAAAAAGPYAESFTAAAMAAGSLSSSPAGAAGSERAAAALTKDSPLLPAQGSSYDAAEAAAATAYAAAVAALPADAADAHTPHLDPPVSLLPSKLLSQLDAAPGRAAASTGGINRSVSALEPKVVQDLADLVAESIAQEVARCKHTGDSPTHAAADACASGAAAAAAGAPRASEEGTAAAAAAAPGAGESGGAELTGLLAGSQLVHKSLGEVLATALTASKKTDAEPDQPAAAPAVRDFFGFSSGGLFAGVAEKLGLHSRSTSQQPQQQQLDATVSAPLTADQQHSWFGSPAVSASGPMHMQGLGGPPGLSAAAGVGMGAAGAGMHVNMPASIGLQGPLTLDPPGLQPQPACAVPVSHPQGATLVPAASMQQQQMMHQPQQQVVVPQGQQQQMVMMPQQGQQQQMVMQQPQQQQMMVQPVPQQQQMVMQQQPHPVMGQQGMQVQPVQGMMVTMAPAQQPGQVVTMQPVAGPTYVQANGQLLHGQFVTIQGAGGQVAGVPVMSGPVPAGTPVMVGPGGNIVSVQQVQQVQHMPPQQHPQQVQVVYGGVPAHMAGGGPVHMMPHQGVQYVQVQMPGGMLQNAGGMQQGAMNMHGNAVPVSSAGHAMHPMPPQQQQHPQQQHHQQRPQQHQQQGMHGGRPQQQGMHGGRPGQGLLRSYQSLHSNSPPLGSSPAQVTILSRSPNSTPGSSLAAGQQKAGAGSNSKPSTGTVSSSGPSNVTVLEAPAGPTACAVVSPGTLQKIMTDPQRPGTGVFLSGGPRKSEPSAPASAGAGEGQAAAAAPAGRPSESDQMAADLEELLNQANEEMGWSSVPNGGKAAEGSQAGST